MRKLILMSLLIMACINQISSQPLIKGIITIQNSKTETGSIKYVKDADIWANAANPTLSDDLGEFSLDYFDKKYGDETFLNIEKSGLEVVNNDILETFIPSNPSSPLRIYMCEKGKLATTILNFRGIAEGQITQRFKEKIKVLEKENRLNSTEILKLENERDIVLEKFKELAKKLAVVNLDDEPKTYSKAYQLFADNKIEQARAQIKNANLGAQLIEYKTSKELGEKIVVGAEKGIKGIANTYILDAQLALVDLDFEGAFLSYDMAIQATDTTDIEHNLEYALLLNSQFKIEKAIKIFLKTLNLTKSNSTLYAYNLFLTGGAHLGKLDTESSTYYFQEAGKVYKSLINTNSTKDYRPFLAISKVMTAASFALASDIPSMISVSREGIDIFKILTAENPTKYKPYLVWSMVAGNVGLDSLEMNQMLEMARELHQSEGKNYATLLATSLFIKTLRLQGAIKGVTNLQEKQQHEDEVLKYLEEAFELAVQQLDSLKSSSPSINLIINSTDTIQNLSFILSQPDVKANFLFTYIKLFSGMSTWMFSVPDVNSKFWKLSRNALKASILKSKELIAINEDRYTPHYLEFSIQLGFMQSIERDAESAITLLQDSYSKTQLLSKKEPETFNLLLAMNRSCYYMSHAIFYLSNGKFYEGMTLEELNKIYVETKSILQNYKNMLFINQLEIILEQWDECFKKEYYPELLLFRSYQETNNIALLSAERKDYLTLINSTGTNLDILEQLNDKYFNIDYGLKLVEKYESWMNLKGELGEIDSLIFYAKEQLHTLNQIRLHDSSNEATMGLSNEYGTLAWYLSILKDYKGAIMCAKKGLEIDSTQKWINTNLALGYLGNNQWNQAIRVYTEFKNTPYQENIGTYKEIFLQDLDSMEVKGFNEELLKRARKFLNKPSLTPKKLKEGIELLQKSNAIYSKAVLENDEDLYQNAIKYYEKLLGSDYFLTFFKGDFKSILLNLAYSYKAINKPIRKIRLLKEATLLDETIKNISKDAWENHKYAAVKNYDDLLYKMDIVNHLINQYRIDNKHKNLEQLLNIYQRNVITFHIFNLQPKQALKILEMKSKKSGQKSWIMSKKIVCYLLNNDFKNANKLFNNYKLEGNSKYLVKILSDDLYNLRNFGINGDTMKKFVKQNNLYE